LDAIDCQLCHRYDKLATYISYFQLPKRGYSGG
jgi:hypothetical protein